MIESVRLRSSPLFVALACFLTIGCGGQAQIASYNASKGKTEYETSGMTIIRRVADSGIGPGSSIKLQAKARCDGKNCTPEVVRFMFSVSGNAGISFQDRTVRITADDQEYEWRDRMQMRQGQTLEREAVAGRIAEVRVRLSQLKQIANASSVSGSIGSRSFELDEDDQAELRALVSAIRNPSAQQETASNSSSDERGDG